jgi:hypothetical protein
VVAGGFAIEYAPEDRLGGFGRVLASSVPVVIASSPMSRVVPSSAGDEQIDGARAVNFASRPSSR